MIGGVIIRYALVLILLYEQVLHSNVNAKQNHEKLNKESPFVVQTNYTRRSNYPEYCSTPSAMDKRKIPVIDVSGIKIDQLFVVVRHGARTPWEGKKLILMNFVVSQYCILETAYILSSPRLLGRLLKR